MNGATGETASFGGFKASMSTLTGAGEAFFDACTTQLPHKQKPTLRCAEFGFTWRKTIILLKPFTSVWAWPDQRTGYTRMISSFLKSAHRRRTKRRFHDVCSTAAASGGSRHPYRWLCLRARHLWRGGEASGSLLH